MLKRLLIAPLLGISVLELEDRRCHLMACLGIHDAVFEESRCC